ncbi:MAG: hypothetical protein ACM3MJ_03890 [Deltaproteobacteria bacterium]
MSAVPSARGLALRPAAPPQDDALDRLADHVEAHLDVAALDDAVIRA